MFLERAVPISPTRVAKPSLPPLESPNALHSGADETAADTVKKHDAHPETEYCTITLTESLNNYHDIFAAQLP